MNTELLSRLGGLAVSCIIIMGLIVIACLVTPKLAKLIEKKNPALADKIEKRGLANDDTAGSPPDKYEVHSAFEASSEEEFDPNYKIYHEDIYALNLGKKKNNKQAEKSLDITGVEENGKE